MMEASLPPPDAAMMADSFHPEMSPDCLGFEEYDLDVRTLELRRKGKPLTLQPRPARVLAVLVQARGELVTAGELRRQVWEKHLRIDFDQSLKTCIKQIRSVLGDDARDPQFIETLPRRGYRFIAPVHEATAWAEADLPAEQAIPQTAAAVRFSRLEIALGGVILLLVVALVMLALLDG